MQALPIQAHPGIVPSLTQVPETLPFSGFPHIASHRRMLLFDAAHMDGDRSGKKGEQIPFRAMRAMD